jgi:hypothetical protein
MTNELISRVFARASDPATIHDNTKYWMAMARIHPRATLEQIAATEVAIGFELPRILKEILMRIGNGGFGPGYGLIGVHGGYADFKGEHLVELGQELGALDRKVLPICNWGCGIYSCLDCAKHEAPVSIFNPQTHALAPENLISVSITSPSGEVNKVYEREHKSPRPSIKTPKDLSLIPHRLSFEDYISDWADGRSLWAEIEPSSPEI